MEILISVAAFFLGFCFRWVITVIKLSNDNINNYIGNMESLLSEMQDSMVDYLALAEESAVLKREPLRLLLVARCGNIYSICNKIKALDKSNALVVPNDTLTQLNQSCDAVFEDYEELKKQGNEAKFEDSYQALAMFTRCSQKLLDSYMLQTPSLFKL